MPVGVNRSKEQARVRNTPLLPLLEIPSYSIMYAKDLAQTHTESMFVSLVSMSFCEPCFVDSVGCLLAVSSTSLAPTLLPPLFFRVPRAHPKVWLCSLPLHPTMASWFLVCWTTSPATSGLHFSCYLFCIVIAHYTIHFCLINIFLVDINATQSNKIKIVQRSQDTTTIKILGSMDLLQFFHHRKQSKGNWSQCSLLCTILEESNRKARLSLGRVR